MTISSTFTWSCEDEPVRNSGETPSHLLRGLGQPLEVPQVLNLLRVQPRLDVGEEAVVDFQAGLKRAHECQNTVAVPLPILRSRVIPAEPEVVIAPDADCTGIGEEIHRLLQAVPQLEHVAEDHEAVGTLLMEDINRPAKVRQALVNVRQDSDPHEQATLAFGGIPSMVTRTSRCLAISTTGWMLIGNPAPLRLLLRVELVSGTGLQRPAR
jgi:hypothetical protein